MIKSDSILSATAPSAAAFLMAQILDEWQVYRNQTLVIKIGGNSIADDDRFLDILSGQMALLQALGLRLLLVHGAGPQIDQALRTAGFSTAKGPDGRRPSSPAMMTVIQGTMYALNARIAEALQTKGCRVHQGTDDAMRHALRVRPLKSLPPEVDRTGFPQRVDLDLLTPLLEQGQIVLLPSLGADAEGLAYNVNADDAAMAFAVALKAFRLIMATNVTGVLDAAKRLLPRLTPAQISRLIDENVISGGMIPKVESAVAALDAGVGGIAIIGAHAPGALLAEILTPTGCGTLIAKEPAPSERKDS